VLEVFKSFSFFCVHNDKAGQTLIVSSLTDGCLSFDARKALTVHLFSCGGRADGCSWLPLSL
jgi:hypothetical protein